MRKFFLIQLFSLLLLALLPAIAQQATPSADAAPQGEQPAGYYIIKLRYLSVEQVATYLKHGGAYAQHIPPSVESIAGIPSLQSIALKTANPEDVLTMTRLITLLDRPAASYDITCTVIITGGKNFLLPENFATLPADDFTTRIRNLVMRQQASLITYPNLHIDLNERGDILPQENTTSYKITPDSVVILPSPYCPAIPAFRISHLPPAANAPTTGRFDQLRTPAEGRLDKSTNFVIEKHDVRNTVIFSYTGLIAVENLSQRVYVIVTVNPR